jgi:hypothetical protein
VCFVTIPKKRNVAALVFALELPLEVALTAQLQALQT